MAARFDPSLTQSFTFMRSTWAGAILRYASAGGVIAAQLLAFHLWLAAGRRRIQDVWPGVLLSTALWLVAASLYSYYLNLSDYYALLRGSVAADGGDDLLPDDGGDRHPRRRAQPRHLRVQAHERCGARSGRRPALQRVRGRA